MRTIVQLLPTTLLLLACASTTPEPASPPVPQPPAMPAASLGFRAGLPSTIDSLVSAGIADGAAPGVAVAVGRHGRVAYMRGYGRIDTVSSAPAVTDSTRFDMASLTKVVATTTAAMILEEEGLLNIDRPVRAYLPELNAPDKATITVRNLLAHNGGFRSGAPLWRDPRGAGAFLQAMNESQLFYAPGDSTIYSDWDLIMVGAIVERITGQRLDAFLEQRVWKPLGMRETGFNPLASGPLPAGAACIVTASTTHPLLSQIAATEIDTLYRKRQVHGIVHDENACALGGVAGHAGLFSSARDLAVFASMMLNGGSYNGVRILKPQTIARWTARQSAKYSRALGWDTPAPGSSSGRFFSPRSFGHTGFTGTSIWMDPEKGIYVVLLTNRVNPTRANMKHEPLRRALADAVQQAVVDAPVTEWLPRPEGQSVITPGADRLFGSFEHLIRGKRVALVSNHSGILKDGTHLADALHRHPDVTLRALFGMEYNIRSNDYSVARDGEQSIDPQTGVVKYNLYGEHHKPAPHMLDSVDVVVFDIQEVGTRFYEHINILGFVMEAAAEKNIDVVVLDRPNPLTGIKVDGFVTDPEFLYRFGSYAQVPVIHGMTMGELGRFYNGEKLLRGGVQANLFVVPMLGWRRSMWYEDTGLPWRKPSPNLLTPASLLAYAGTCIFEALNLSEGRGTDHPFEYIGAPWLDNTAAVAMLNDLKLRGVTFEAVEFVPEQKPFHGRPPEMAGERVKGIALRVTDPKAFEPYKAGVAILWAVHRLHPEKLVWNDAVLERLTATRRLKTMILAGRTPSEIFDAWRDEVAAYRVRSRPYHMYL